MLTDGRSGRESLPVTTTGSRLLGNGTGGPPSVGTLLRRYVWALLAVASLGAALSGVVGLTAARRYEATTTTRVPSSGDARAAARLAEDLQAVVDEPAATAAIARRTRVPEADLRGRVTIRQAGASSTIRWRLRVDESRRDQASAILLATVEEAHRAVMRPDLTEAESALTTATAALEEAQAALADFTQRTGFPGPDAYARLQSELTALRIRAQTARAEGELVIAVALDRQVEALQTLVTVVGAQANEHDALVAQRERAEARVDRAQVQRDALDARLEALQATVARPTDPVPVTPTPMIVRRAAASAIAAAAIAAIALGVIEQRRKAASTRPRTRTEELRRTMGAV